MGEALLSAVSGLKAHQQMIDVAGNNLANVNTYGFKSSRISFSEMMAQTIRQASQPTDGLGGTNPMQVGSGTQLSSISRDMSNGSLVVTGQTLDMAIEGEGYFVLNDGEKDVYTRVGAFGVDSQYYLVDPSTGYRIQRIGTEGVSDGFQDAADTGIKIPYSASLPAQATETVRFSGNLSADNYSPTTNLMSSGIQYTSSGAAIGGSTLLVDLDQADAVNILGETITVSGFDSDGNAINNTLTVNANTDMDDLLATIDAAFVAGDASATVVNGEIRITDTDSGYSLTDVNLSISNADTLEVPKFFTILEPGGESTKITNLEIFDAQGISHILSAAFVRTGNPLDPNEWDCVLTDITGDVTLSDRRVRGLGFQEDGSFGGMTGADANEFSMYFANAPSSLRTITMDFGSTGNFDGLTQFGGSSTAAPAGQDGYGPGYLSSMSVSPEGTLVGTFSNGVRRDVAAIKLAYFQNPAGMESIGGNYYLPTANSGDPIGTRGLAGGAGAIRGESLERSNVDVAAQFVDLIQAQNGYQANARTISVANEMLRELTQLIR